MRNATQTWQLSSGTWHRDPASEIWRLAMTPDGTVVHPALPSQDVGRLIGAMRDVACNEWLPSEFAFSPRTGAPLEAPSRKLRRPEMPWVPPYGAAALSDMGRPSARGLRVTQVALGVSRQRERPAHAGDGADPVATLPALPPGEYRFLVHPLDSATSTLLAIEPSQGGLLALLPESRTWMPLEPASAHLAAAPHPDRGWRMEVLEGIRYSTLHLPTTEGLASVTPSLMGLSYEVEYAGDGAALGGPVAWAGKVWLPVARPAGGVGLVGQPQGAGKATTVEVEGVPVPQNGFEGPVFDAQHVIWPCDEGQLVARADRSGEKEVQWIEWPEGLRPAFALGSPYLAPDGSFWQPCWRRGDASGESLQYVRMGMANPDRAAVDTPLTGTGHASFHATARLLAEPWSAPERVAPGTSGEVIVPLLESAADGAIVSLRMDAPQGLHALLESGAEPQQAVVQVQTRDGAQMRLIALGVRRPWRASVFVHEGHLWLYHPELSQALGWKLEN